MKEAALALLMKIGTLVLQQGPTPKHIGFICDGNRRYAKKQGIEISQGHRMGYEKLFQLFEWCEHTGIQEITLYLFSIENFKRSKDQVDFLKKLFKELCDYFMNNLEKTIEKGFCIHFVGDWNLLENFKRPLVSEIMLKTRYGNKFRINFAVCYSARNEITNGLNLIQEGISNNDILLDDISQDLILASMQLIPSKPLDFFVRTSEETRLSDFMLLEQSSKAIITFIPVLWPELSYMDILKVLLNYQIQIKKLEINPDSGDEMSKPDSEEENRKERFLNKVREQRWNVIEAEAKKLY